MSEDVYNASDKVILSKFSSDSVKTVSDAKISAGACGDLKQSQKFTQIKKKFKLRNGNQKLHNKNCKFGQNRRRNIQHCRSKDRRCLQMCPHVIKAKVCKTSPLLGPKSDLKTTASINAVCKSDEGNCSVKVNRGWKLKNVFNKLRCLSHKVVLDTNLSQSKVSNESSDKISSLVSSHGSCRLWKSQEMRERSSKTINVTSCSDRTIIQSSKSGEHRPTSSACAVAPETSDGTNNDVQTAHLIEFIRDSKSVKTLTPFISSNISGNSGNSRQMKRRDQNDSSLQLLQSNKSCFECPSQVKLKTLKSAPALLRNLSFINPSVVKAPSEKDVWKVSVAVDKLCQTPSQILPLGKVSTSTSCTTNISCLFSDKEIQNEMSSLHALNASVNKMCQTESVRNLSTAINKGTQANEETWRETLSDFSQPTRKPAEASFKEQVSGEEHFPEQYESFSSEETISCEGNLSDIRCSSSAFEHQILDYCCCSKNLDRIRKKLGWLENEKLTERTKQKCIADNEFATTESCKHEKCSHILATREKYTCRRHLPKALYPQNSKSEHAVENHEICTSVGYIQQPSILKSSSSFLRVDPHRNHVDCHACNIHRNHELWESKKSCCYDFSLTRANFLKLYPEPYINHLSNAVSNVQLIFHKEGKNQKQLYVCQECKMNASWNRHARKHRLSPKWRKSISTCDSQTPSSAPDAYSSSTDACSKAFTNSKSYHCNKSKQMQQKKVKRRRKPRQENFRLSYKDVENNISQLEMNPDQRTLNHGDGHGSMLDPSKQCSMNSPQHKTTDAFLPPPPPPLYEYPAYSCRYNEGEYTKTYPHGQRFRVNSQKKSPEVIGSKMNEPIGPQQKNTPCNRVQESSSLLNKYQITRHSSLKGIESSHSETSNAFVQPNNQKYVTEKAGAGFSNYNKSSNHLLRYPGFGDCVSSQPITFSQKKKQASADTKVRKKIKDKYRRDGASVRCLIREALITERNNKYGRKSLTAEKEENCPSRNVSTAESFTRMTTLHGKNQSDFSSETHKNNVKSCSFNKKPANEHTIPGAFQSSKNTFCQLSDTSVISETAMEVSAWAHFNDKHRKIFRSESMQWPNISNSAKREVTKRFSEEFTSQRPVFEEKHSSTRIENDTQESFRNETVKTLLPSGHDLRTNEDLSSSNESLSLYFRLMDVIAKKRQQFKKEERRRRMKFQEPKLINKTIVAANKD